jgi:hypothetical protein
LHFRCDGYFGRRCAVNVLPFVPVLVAESVERTEGRQSIKRSWKKRARFLGSNAGHVVRYAKCSVICGFRSRSNIAGMAEEVPAFLRAETPDYATDPAQKARYGALSCRTQMSLEFAEGRLDRVEVWRIRWEVKQLCTRPLDRLPDTDDLVSRQIIYDDDVTALKDRDDALPHIGKKHRPVHGTLKHERRDHGALAQAGDKRNYFPLPLRRIADQALSARATAAQPYHAGARPGLVNKYQSGRVKHALLPHPAPARAGDFRAFLLRRVQSFF